MLLLIFDELKKKPFNVKSISKLCLRCVIYFAFCGSVVAFVVPLVCH